MLANLMFALLLRILADTIASLSSVRIALMAGMMVRLGLDG